MVDLNDLSKVLSERYEHVNNWVKDAETQLSEGNISESQLQYIIKALGDDSRKNVQKLSERLKNTLAAKESEIKRVRLLYDFDRAMGKGRILAGVDEVGRGPLAGPIVSAAVILDLDANNDELILKINDSKKVSAENRERLSKIIMGKALSVSISILDNKEIDEKGIGWCNNEVLKKSSEGLALKPDIVISDGYPIKGIKYENKFIIKGDSKSASIACASIVAKVFRDNLMKNLSAKYPQYGFEKHVGYGTAEHIAAVKKYGPCDIHRMSFLKNII